MRAAQPVARTASYQRRVRPTPKVLADAPSPFAWRQPMSRSRASPMGWMRPTRVYFSFLAPGAAARAMPMSAASFHASLIE